MMGEILLYIATSLDGYIATADGGVAWLTAFESADEDYGYADFLSTVDLLLMGRTTYEQLLTFGVWPYEGKQCVVFGHRPIADPNVTVCDSIESFKEQWIGRFQRAWLVGGAELVTSFRAHQLISQYILSIIPTILGDGIPLWQAPLPTQPLQQINTTTYPNGLVQIIYQPIRQEPRS